MLRNPRNFILLLVAVYSQTFPQRATAYPSTNELDVFKRDGSATYDSALTLISVAREPTPEGNRFTVRYTKNADHLTFRVQDNMDTPREPTVTQEADGIWAATFVMPVIPDSSQWFIMSDTVGMHLVALKLDGSDSTPAQQNVTGLPVIQLDPSPEAVYQPDEDIHVKVTVPKNSETGKTIDNMQKMFSGVDLNTMTMHQDFDDDDAFTIGHPTTLADSLEVSITAHTSRRPMSGYLQLSTQVINTGGSVVWQIQVSRSVLVKPAGQTGPYPAGFLAFIDGMSQETSPDGNEMRRCVVGYECLILCSSVGSSISEIEVRQVEEDGRLVDVPSAEEGPNTHATARDIYWKFQAQEDSGDDNGITRFWCKATDLTHGSVVTKLIDVRADILGSIDHSRSGVTVEDDPMLSDRKILTFRCAISGRPLPEVTFYAGSAYQFNIYADPPDDVIRTGQNEGIATRVVTLDASDLAQAIQSINAGQDTGPSCSIYSSYHGNVTSYEFYPRAS
ncbi:hypothetical protein ElyMa_001274400 [Elysia marginata]|uniref:Ig-like domain-containing protein n=1 Tax=Elysia marginata TaxID=1093978 RepID=A0AAV4IHB5_9GAST|nr:hypothetical protein ElyMa_001274400 [Elysia marginata]